jgi:hypothetical protein
MTNKSKSIYMYFFFQLSSDNDMGIEVTNFNFCNGVLIQNNLFPINSLYTARSVLEAGLFLHPQQNWSASWISVKYSEFEGG